MVKVCHKKMSDHIKSWEAQGSMWGWVSFPQVPVLTVNVSLLYIHVLSNKKKEQITRKR
jgi:hypothetical protein